MKTTIRIYRIKSCFNSSKANLVLCRRCKKITIWMSKCSQVLISANNRAVKCSQIKIYLISLMNISTVKTKNNCFRTSPKTISYIFSRWLNSFKANLRVRTCRISFFQILLVPAKIALAQLTKWILNLWCNRLWLLRRPKTKTKKILRMVQKSTKMMMIMLSDIKHQTRRHSRTKSATVYCTTWTTSITLMTKFKHPVNN